MHAGAGRPARAGRAGSVPARRSRQGRWRRCGKLGQRAQTAHIFSDGDSRKISACAGTATRRGAPPLSCRRSRCAPARTIFRPWNPAGAFAFLRNCGGALRTCWRPCGAPAQRHKRRPFQCLRTRCPFSCAFSWPQDRRPRRCFPQTSPRARGPHRRSGRPSARSPCPLAVAHTRSPSAASALMPFHSAGCPASGYYCASSTREAVSTTCLRIWPLRTAP